MFFSREEAQKDDFSLTRVYAQGGCYVEWVKLLTVVLFSLSCSITKKFYSKTIEWMAHYIHTYIEERIVEYDGGG